MSIFEDQLKRERSVIFNCEYCGIEIREGDDYFDVHISDTDWRPFCTDCVGKFTASIDDLYL